VGGAAPFSLILAKGAGTMGLLLPALLARVQQLPAVKPPVAPQDTVELPGLGRAAERLLTSDSLESIPAQLEAWWAATSVAAVALLPRLLVAIIVAAIVAAATLWLRGRARSRTGGDEESLLPRQIGTVGMLVAATAAFTIVGATSLAAALLTFTIFYAAAAALWENGCASGRRPAVCGASPSAPPASRRRTTACS